MEQQVSRRGVGSQALVVFSVLFYANSIEEIKFVSGT